MTVNLKVTVYLVSSFITGWSHHCA